MNSLRHLFALAAASLWFAAPIAFAATETRTFTVGSPTGNIPDNQDPPTTFLQTITDSVITSLIKVEVGLKLVGFPTSGSGFAGDMFVSLNKDLALGATSILLNRVGATDSTPAGFSYNGWDVIFSDTASTDVHAAVLSSGLLSGTFQPDGRILPTATERPALLSEFFGDSGNGDWYLSVGDLALNGTMRLESWSLTFSDEVTPVPEPGTYLAGSFALLILVVTWLKRNQNAVYALWSASVPGRSKGTK